jgi:acylphosphatase
MTNNFTRAEITNFGLVQGVGFRYFVYGKARELGLTGFVKNNYDGTVLTVVEGEKSKIEILFNFLKVGPMHADVRDIKIAWRSYSAEFSSFEIRRY